MELYSFLVKFNPYFNPQFSLSGETQPVRPVRDESWWPILFSIYARGEDKRRDGETGYEFHPQKEPRMKGLHINKNDIAPW
jgi:hypothetical protein